MIGLAIGVIFGLTGVAALASWKGKPAQDQASLLATLLTTIVQIARKTGVTVQQKLDAVNAAQALGLPRTAQAVAAESSLPTTELWPGTTMSVAVYIARVLAQTTAAQAKSMKPVASTTSPQAATPTFSPATQSPAPASGPTPEQVQAAAAAAQAQVQAAAASFGPMHGWRRR